MKFLILLKFLATIYFIYISYMFIYKRHKTLGNKLKLLDVFAITTGATLSGDFILLPGLAAAAGTMLVFPIFWLAFLYFLLFLARQNLQRQRLVISNLIFTIHPQLFDTKLSIT